MVCLVRWGQPLSRLLSIYNFSCTDMCSYWVLYIIDSSMPLGGRCSTLPCVLDTTSVMKDAITVYDSLNLVSKNWITISTNGTLKMVAQCAYLASFKDPLVVRQGVMLRIATASPCGCATPEPSTVPRPSPYTIVPDCGTTTDTAQPTTTNLSPSLDSSLLPARLNVSHAVMM